MELPTNVKSDCQTCRRRPPKDGGCGSCPFSPSLRRAYRGGGGKGTADCPHYDQREYVPPRVKKQMQNHPQEAALF